MNNANIKRNQLEKELYRSIMNGNLVEARKIKNQLETIYAQMKLSQPKVK